MNVKCPGCGVIIQTDHPDKIGYINKDVLEKRKDNFLCERCYRLKHYNEVKNEEVAIDFDKVFKHISNEKCLIVNIIDAFDLLGSVIPDINKKFPKAKVLIIANKYDLFMRSNRPTKLRAYLKSYLKEKNINYTFDSMVAGGTDSGELSKVYDGVINMTLSLPCRYFHSHTSVINLKDYEACIELLVEFVKRLDENKLNELKEFKR